MADESDAVLIGLIITIAIIGIAGGVTLTVLACFKWREIMKQRANNRHIGPASRQPTRRRRIRVRNANNSNANNNSGQTGIEMPPPYSEIDINAPPAYSSLNLLAPPEFRESLTRGTRESTTRGTRESSTRGTLGTMTPMATPAGSMFTTSIGGTREPSASSNVRSANMVHIT